MNTPWKRLEIYRQALKDWEVDSAPTKVGFCLYFRNRGITDAGFFFGAVLPELYNQVPENRFLDESGTEYWFEIGTEHGRYLRRVCLRTAIEEVERLILTEQRTL